MFRGEQVVGSAGFHFDENKGALIIGDDVYLGCYLLAAQTPPNRYRVVGGDDPESLDQPEVIECRALTTFSQRKMGRPRLPARPKETFNRIKQRSRLLRSGAILSAR